jgi:hypothetical protein
MLNTSGALMIDGGMRYSTNGIILKMVGGGYLCRICVITSEIWYNRIMNNAPQFNNLDIGCFFMLRYEEVTGKYPKPVLVRKVMYHHAHGSMDGWNKGWYCSYFQDGYFTSSPYASSGTRQLWQRNNDGTWKLTPIGFTRAMQVKEELQKMSNCLLGTSKTAA